jgi:hypothetical protein
MAFNAALSSVILLRMVLRSFGFKDKLPVHRYPPSVDKTD